MNNTEKKTTPIITMIPASLDKKYKKKMNSDETKKLREDYMKFMFPEAFDKEDENDNRCK